jgi:hypothetical protein
LISYFRSVIKVVCFLLGNTPASEFYMTKFRNTLSVEIDMKKEYSVSVDHDSNPVRSNKNQDL